MVDVAEMERLRVEIAGLHGHIQALGARVGAQDATDGHHRPELEPARAEAGDLRVARKEAKARVEERRRLVAESRDRLAEAERAREQAEQERAAVIAALGRRAREQLREPDPDGWLLDLLAAPARRRRPRHATGRRRGGDVGG